MDNKKGLEMKNSEWKKTGKHSPYDKYPKYDKLKYEMTKKLTNSCLLAKHFSKHSDSRFIKEMKLLWDSFII